MSKLLERVLGPENKRAHFARGAASTIHQTQVVVLDLALTRLAHDLAHPFDHVTETARQARLATRELTTIGINRETAFICRISGFVKRTDLTLFAKPSIFEAHGREDGISIIKFGELHILRSIPGHLKGPRG